MQQMHDKMCFGVPGVVSIEYEICRCLPIMVIKA